MSKKTLYDHPLYYDILFGWDRTLEAAFYHRLFERAGMGLREPVLEVACGTGQIARRLASLGRDVTGLDLSPDMLAFLTEQARAEGVVVETLCADMTNFSSDRLYGAAFNPMSSFRLLHSDETAVSHLRAIAAVLRVGGVYALDLTFNERGEDIGTTTSEDWTMRRGDITVRATNDAIHVDDGARHVVLEWGVDGHLRDYAVASFVGLVTAVPAFEIEAWYPEVARVGEEGISTFDADDPQPTASGRAIVLLRRI
jgi:SAM-dependent methyltransferase